MDRPRSPREADAFLLPCAAACLALLAAAERATAQGSIRYIGERQPGIAEAVVVEGRALVHTAQLLPCDRQGQVVGEGAVDAQLAQVLFNLAHVVREHRLVLRRLFAEAGDLGIDARVKRAATHA